MRERRSVDVKNKVGYSIRNRIENSFRNNFWCSAGTAACITAGDPESRLGDIADYRQRDAVSLRMLGFFFAVLGTLVWVGTFWSLDNVRAIIVNAASGGVLVAVGVGMLALSRRNGSQQTDNSP